MPTTRTRRPAPPDATNAEASYLRQAVQSKAAFFVELLGGAELRGRLIAYDRDCLKLQPDGEPPLLVRKEHVRCYWAARQRRAREPRPEAPEAR